MMKKDFFIVVALGDRMMRETLRVLLTLDGYHATAIDPEHLAGPGLRTDCVITDRMLDKTGFARTQFVLLARQYDADLVTEGILRQYDGFLLNEDGPTALRECLDRLREKRKYFSPTLQRRTQNSGLDALSTPAVALLDRLSKREREILRLLTGEQSGKQVASDLCISYRTLVNHKTNMAQKLEFASVTQLIPFAFTVKDYL